MCSQLPIVLIQRQFYTLNPTKLKKTQNWNFLKINIIISCKRAIAPAKSTEDSLLDFMSQNSNSNGSRKFEYPVF